MPPEARPAWLEYALAGVPDTVLARARRTALLLLDVDGVLTDGRLWFADDGSEMKAFHARDGHGLKMLQAAGIPAGIVTSRTSPVVERRARELGLAHLYQGSQDKLATCRALFDQLGLAPEQVAFVGDDVIDLPVMTRIGLAVAVADANPVVTAHAHWTTRTAGGNGAVREVVDLLLAAQGRLADAVAPYTG
jgi:3-deoxy-D-manno-octulosonate 8-phosphate phosphatase (KDO 8-P phosphatase)